MNCQFVRFVESVQGNEDKEISVQFSLVTSPCTRLYLPVVDGILQHRQHFDWLRLAFALVDGSYHALHDVSGSLQVHAIRVSRRSVFQQLLQLDRIAADLLDGTQQKTVQRNPSHTALEAARLRHRHRQMRTFFDCITPVLRSVCLWSVDC